LDQTSPWKIRIEGLVRQRKILLLDDLRPLVRPAGVHLMECSGNTAGGRFGMLNAASWSGIPMARLLAMAEPTSRAKRVLVSGFDTYSRPSEHRSTPGASWIFTPEQLRKAGAFLATEMNGAALSPDHGAPVRLVVPGWYGCTCAKWVDEIRFVEDEVPSTPQMREFAGRTHQNGVPRLARDYRPAAIEQAAMAVRVEQRRLQGRPSYRVVGVTWGGQRLTQGLVIRFNPDEEYRPVQVLAAPQEKTTWALWACDWQPLRPGLYAIQLQLNDARVPKRRLDRGHYTRTVQVADV